MTRLIASLFLTSLVLFIGQNSYAIPTKIACGITQWPHATELTDLVNPTTLHLENNKTVETNIEIEENITAHIEAAFYGQNLTLTAVVAKMNRGWSPFFFASANNGGLQFGLNANSVFGRVDAQDIPLKKPFESKSDYSQRVSDALAALPQYQIANRMFKGGHELIQVACILISE